MLPWIAWLCCGISVGSKRHGRWCRRSARCRKMEPVDALPLLHRRIALHVGQPEGALAVAAIGGAEQGEQRGVLRDRHQLAVAEGPSPRRKIEREDADLGHEWIRHGPVLALARINAEQRNDEVDAKVGLHVVVRLVAADERARLVRHRRGGRRPRDRSASRPRSGPRHCRSPCCSVAVFWDAAIGWEWTGSCWVISVTCSAPPISPMRIAAGLVQWKAALQVRQGECGLAVAAIGGPDQIVQGVVLRDRQRPVPGRASNRPARNCRRTSESRRYRAGSWRASFSSGRKDALQCDAEAEREVGLHVLVGLRATGIADGARDERREIAGRGVEIGRRAPSDCR